MRKTILIFAIALGLACRSAGQERDVFNQTVQPSTLLKPSLIVRCVRDLNYWKQPDLKNFWSWMPKLDFAISGPIDDASYLTYEFFKPDGKLWYSLDSTPFSTSEGQLQKFASEAVPRWTDKRSTIETGVFSFKITLNNPLKSTSKVLYQGKFNVRKEFAGTTNADFKNEYLYYVEQDWMLPMAYLNFDSRDDADSPIFRPAMWFRGDFNGKLKAYLFYNGKQVANTEVGGARQTSYVFIEGDGDNKFRWEQWAFNFYNARYFDNKGENAERHVFRNKPGSYEIKVLLDDEIVRIVPFTVGSDGKIVDNSVSKNNGLSGFGIVVPARVLPVKEGAVNLLSYKTDGFYGNPLIGF